LGLEEENVKEPAASSAPDSPVRPPVTTTKSAQGRATSEHKQGSKPVEVLLTCASSWRNLTHLCKQLEEFVFLHKQKREALYSKL